MIVAAKANGPPGLLRRRWRQGLRRLRRRRFRRSRVHRHAAKHHGFSNRRFKHELLALGVAVGAGLVDGGGDRLVPFRQVGGGSADADGIRPRLEFLHLPRRRRCGTTRGEAHDAGEETEQQRSFDIVPHVSMLPEIRRRFFPVENGNGATAAFVKKNGKIEARGFFK